MRHKANRVTQYRYKKPYWVVKCDEGFLACKAKKHWQSGKIYISAYIEPVRIKHRKNENGEWESYAECSDAYVVKRKTKEFIDKQVALALNNFGNTNIPPRFTGATPILIDEIPWGEFIENEYKDMAEADQIEQRRKHNY